VKKCREVVPPDQGGHDQVFVGQALLAACKIHENQFYGATILKVIRRSVGVALMIPLTKEGIRKRVRRGTKL
jgi:hypothetical protein